MLLSLEWQKCWEMFRQRSLMFAAYFPYEAIESATLFCESTTLLYQSTTLFCESATLFFVDTTCSSRIKLRTKGYHFTRMREFFGRNKVMDWTISHFWQHFHTKNKVVDSDAEPKMCDIRRLYHPRSFLVFPSANDRPFAPRARRSFAIAFGPIPWSCLSSVSLTLVNCSSRR